MEYLDILMKKYEKAEFLLKDQKELLSEFFLKNQSEISRLYELIDIIEKKENVWEFNGLKYKFDNNVHIISIGFDDVKLSKDEIRELCISTLMVLEEILPLGTVVDLDKSSMSSNLSNIDNFRIVIVDRFVSNSQVEGFFEYVGVVYPLGKPNKNAVISFSPHIIEKVVYKGYSDEVDEAFVKLMKIQLLIEKNYTSVSFLSEDKKALLKEYVEGVKNGR